MEKAAQRSGLCMLEDLGDPEVQITKTGNKEQDERTLQNAKLLYKIKTRQKQIEDLASGAMQRQEKKLLLAQEKQLTVATAALKNKVEETKRDPVSYKKARLVTQLQSQDQELDRKIEMLTKRLKRALKIKDDELPFLNTGKHKELSPTGRAYTKQELELMERLSLLKRQEKWWQKRLANIKEELHRKEAEAGGHSGGGMSTFDRQYSVSKIIGEKLGSEDLQQLDYLSTSNSILDLNGSFSLAEHESRQYQSDQRWKMDETPGYLSQNNSTAESQLSSNGEKIIVARTYIPVQHTAEECYSQAGETQNHTSTAFEIDERELKVPSPPLDALDKRIKRRQSVRGSADFMPTVPSPTQSQFFQSDHEAIIHSSIQVQGSILQPFHFFSEEAVHGDECSLQGLEESQKFINQISQDSVSDGLKNRIRRLGRVRGAALRKKGKDEEVDDSFTWSGGILDTLFSQKQNTAPAEVTSESRLWKKTDEHSQVTAPLEGIEGSTMLGVSSTTAPLTQEKLEILVNKETRRLLKQRLKKLRNVLTTVAEESGRSNERLIQGLQYFEKVLSKPDGAEKLQQTLEQEQRTLACQGRTPEEIGNALEDLEMELSSQSRTQCIDLYKLICREQRRQLGFEEADEQKENQEIEEMLKGNKNALSNKDEIEIILEALELFENSIEKQSRHLPKSSIAATDSCAEMFVKETLKETTKGTETSQLVSSKPKHISCLESSTSESFNESASDEETRETLAINKILEGKLGDIQNLPKTNMMYGADVKKNLRVLKGEVHGMDTDQLKKTITILGLGNPNDDKSQCIDKLMAHHLKTELSAMFEKMTIDELGNEVVSRKIHISANTKEEIVKRLTADTIALAADQRYLYLSGIPVFNNLKVSGKAPVGLVYKGLVLPQNKKIPAGNDKNTSLSKLFAKGFRINVDYESSLKRARADNKEVVGTIYRRKKQLLKGIFQSQESLLLSDGMAVSAQHRFGPMSELYDSAGTSPSRTVEMPPMDSPFDDNQYWPTNPYVPRERRVSQDSVALSEKEIQRLLIEGKAKFGVLQTGNVEDVGKDNQNVQESALAKAINKENKLYRERKTGTRGSVDFFMKTFGQDICDIPVLPLEAEGKAFHPQERPRSQKQPRGFESPHCRRNVQSPNGQSSWVVGCPNELTRDPMPPQHARAHPLRTPPPDFQKDTTTPETNIHPGRLVKASLKTNTEGNHAAERDISLSIEGTSTLRKASIPKHVQSELTGEGNEIHHFCKLPLQPLTTSDESVSEAPQFFVGAAYLQPRPPNASSSLHQSPRPSMDKKRHVGKQINSKDGLT